MSFKKIFSTSLLICLLALVQTGALIHELSHLNIVQFSSASLSGSEVSEQPVKKTASETCLQCLAYTQFEGTVISQAVGLPLVNILTAYCLGLVIVFFATFGNAYRARAPPYQ